MSRHDLILQCLNNSSCSFKYYSIHCMCQTLCDVTSNNFLGRFVQCEQKGWNRGRWVGMYTQRVKRHGCVWVWLKKFLSRVIAQKVLENSHLTSQGLHAVFKCDLLARAGLHCLSNLITNVLRTTECNHMCRKTHVYRVWLPAEYIACALSMLSSNSPDYVIHGPGKYIHENHNSF